MNDILKNRRGYSLIEGLIVLLCAGILITLAVPNIQRLQQEWTLWGSVRLVEASLRWGRMRAISTNTSLAFIVSNDGRRYSWIDPGSGKSYSNSVRSLPGAIRIESGPKRPLHFYQHGNAVPAGTYLVRGPTGSYSVIASPGGRIRIEKN